MGWALVGWEVAGWEVLESGGRPGPAPLNYVLRRKICHPETKIRGQVKYRVLESIKVDSKLN